MKLKLHWQEIQAKMLQLMFSRFDHSCIFLYVFARIIVLDFAP